MRIINITCLLICSIFVARAQEDIPQAFVENEPTMFALWNFKPGDTTAVLIDMANIRSSDTYNSTILDSLPAGTEVYIKKIAHLNQKIRGFYAPWYEIFYDKDGMRKSGFIWSGLLALGKTSTKDAQTIIHGFSRYIDQGTDEPYYVCEVKLLHKSGQLIDRTTFNVHYDGQTFFDARIEEPKGLENVDYIYSFSIHGEACGIPTEYHYAAFTNHKLVQLPSTYSVGDADVYSYSEELIFPADHKKEKDLIIKRISKSERINDLDSEEGEYEESESEKKYYWNKGVLTEVITFVN